MTEFLTGSTYFPVVLTLAVFFLMQQLQNRWKLAVLNPILLSGFAIIFLLRLLGVSNETYQTGCQSLSFLLTPATICLAASFYEQFQKLKEHLLAVTIGSVLSQEIGGIAAITTAAICITGIGGNIMAPSLAKLFRLDSQIAQGVACGTASHVIGTARATQMGELAGAVSSLALTLAGIITCVVLSFLTQYL